MMQNEKLRGGKNKYVLQIEQFLRESDVNGDGSMDQEELQIILDHPDLQEWLELIGLEGHDVMGLYSILANSEGEVSHEDLIEGILRLSGGVRAIDSVVVMHGQRQILFEIEELVKSMETHTG